MILGLVITAPTTQPCIAPAKAPHAQCPSNTASQHMGASTAAATVALQPAAAPHLIAQAASYMAAPSLPILAAYIQLTEALMSAREVARALQPPWVGGGRQCWFPRRVLWGEL